MLSVKSLLKPVLFTRRLPFTQFMCSKSRSGDPMNGAGKPEVTSQNNTNTGVSTADEIARAKNQTEYGETAHVDQNTSQVPAAEEASILTADRFQKSAYQELSESIKKLNDMMHENQQEYLHLRKSSEKFEMQLADAEKEPIPFGQRTSDLARFIEKLDAHLQTTIRDTEKMTLQREVLIAKQLNMYLAEKVSYQKQIKREIKLKKAAVNRVGALHVAADARENLIIDLTGKTAMLQADVKELKRIVLGCEEQMHHIVTQDNADLKNVVSNINLLLENVDTMTTEELKSSVGGLKRMCMAFK